MLKSLTKLKETETNEEWRVERRTRGKDLENAKGGKPIQTWVLILSNSLGYRRFVPEARIWEFYKLAEEEVKTEAQPEAPSEAEAAE